MWTYRISTGEFVDADGVCRFQGYSGRGIGKNNPELPNLRGLQSLPHAGPILEGAYTITTPKDSVAHGPYVLWLVPNQANEMYGRAGFGIHGDSITEPGSASLGCIVTGHENRVAIWESGDHGLKVIR